MPFMPGLHRRYSAGTEGSEAARWSKSQKPCRGADWGLQLTHEGGIGSKWRISNAAVNTFPGLVHTAVTPRESGLSEVPGLTGLRAGGRGR